MYFGEFFGLLQKKERFLEVRRGSCNFYISSCMLSPVSFRMVMNIGVAVSHTTPTVECHIMDSRFETQTLYNTYIYVCVLGKLRDMIKFSDGFHFQHPHLIVSFFS